LERRGHRFVRYADDCDIYVQSQRAGERVMASAKQFLTRRLKLKVTARRARSRAPVRANSSASASPARRRRIAPQALARYTSRVRALTRRMPGVSPDRAIDRLSVYLTGWRGYFGFCQTASVLRDLDGWVRRRLRCLAWVQWRSGRRRYRALRQHGISMLLAATTAAAARAHGPWRLSRHPALQAALPTTFFAAHGLPTLAPAAS